MIRTKLLSSFLVGLLLILSSLGKGQQGASPFFDQRFDFFQGAEGGLSITPTDTGFLAMVVSSNAASDIDSKALRVLQINPDGSLDSLKTYYGSPSNTQQLGPMLGRGGLTRDRDGNFLYPSTYEDSSLSYSPHVHLMKFTPQGDSIWTRTYGTTSRQDIGMDVVPAPDGNGYAILGSEATGNWDVELYRIDSTGTLLWKKTYGNSQYTFARSLDTTPDGGYVIGGHSQAFFPIDSSAWAFIMKTDSTGNQEWVRGFTADSSEQLTSDGDLFCTVTADSNIAFAAPLSDSMYDNTRPYKHMAVGKLDLNGDTLWYKEFNRSEVNYSVLSIRECPNEDLLLVGRVDPYQDSIGYLRARGWMMRISPQGDSIWERTYTMKGGGSKSDYYFYGGRPENDSNMLATGFGQDLDTGNNQDLWIAKTNCQGFIHGPQAAFSYERDSSRGIVFKDSSSHASERYWSFGDGYFSNLKDPAHTYPDTNSYSVTLVASSCGYSDTVTKLVEPRIVKDSTSDTTAIPPQKEKGTYMVRVHPNPSEGRFIVQHELSEGRIEVYDMQGRQVHGSSIEKSGSQTLQLKEQEAGLYMLRLVRNGETVHHQKLILR